MFKFEKLMIDMILKNASNWIYTIKSITQKEREDKYIHCSNYNFVPIQNLKNVLKSCTNFEIHHFSINVMIYIILFTRKRYDN